MLSLIFLIFIGIITGIASQLNILSVYPIGELSSLTIFSRIAFGATLFPFLLLGLRKIIRRIVSRSELPNMLQERYKKYDTFTYTVFLLSLFGAVGMQFTVQVVILMIFIFLSLQIFLIYFLMDKQIKREIYSSISFLSFLFLISGFAALIYQIVWQKALFTAFGVNIESVTIIVSIFMFGLGIGSILGGILSTKYPFLLPQFFLIFEVLIGLFGIMSLPLIKIVSYAPVHNSLFKISLATFSLLCFPTMLMGATLPILVSYLHVHDKNIGKSVGKLYALNTIGSAIACFITAGLFFVLFGKQTTVIIAALCNFSVGYLVYRYMRSRKKEEVEYAGNTFIQGMHKGRKEVVNKKIRFSLIFLLAAMTGYISLSQEILWFRAISYVTGGKPDVFAYILGFFLFGIAFGALIAKRICEKEKDALIFIAIMLSLSSLFYYLSFPLAGQLLIVSENVGLFKLYLFVGIISFLIGGIFPALCHFGIKSTTSIGLPLSWVYFANIIGSTAGPLITGFVLLNYYTLEQNILYISIVTLTLAGIIWITCNLSPLRKKWLMGSVALGIIGMLSMHSTVYSNILEKFHYKTGYGQKKPYKYILQNRSGIIAVESNITDIVYGGGVYDGSFNIDPVLNTNLITRAYIIPILHPRIEEVLQIGLGTGSWARVIANHTSVKKLTIVEINPGYTEIIQHYPEIATILRDPKVTIYIDDGRRWLNRNPEAKFDFIVMNTTFHWRDGATNLLSDEFLRICKSHLKNKGLVYYNMTFSEDVPFTAAQVFKYIDIYYNFVIASDSSFIMGRKERRQNLLNFRNSGKPVFDKNNIKLQHVLEELVAINISDKADMFRKKSGLWHITDDNMATEFKLRNIWFNPEATWANLINPKNAYK